MFILQFLRKHLPVPHPEYSPHSDRLIQSWPAGRQSDEILMRLPSICVMCLWGWTSSLLSPHSVSSEIVLWNLTFAITFTLSRPGIFIVLMDKLWRRAQYSALQSEDLLSSGVLRQVPRCDGMWEDVEMTEWQLWLYPVRIIPAQHTGAHWSTTAQLK